MDFYQRFYTKYITYTGLLLLLLASCANPVAPTGGPKDVAPPEILRTSPPDQSTNFTGNEIILYFNEYVNLKDIGQQLIISPPVNEPASFKSKGKSLVAEFKDPWRSETTYNIFFGNAIVDITESNPLPGYKFTFSTGNILDSMKIEGKLTNAFNLTPVKAAYVMLYDTIYDSIPYKQIPYYIARTNDQGEFELTNLRNRPYKIFALTDINANYMYDMPTEEISFVDTLITPWEETKKAGALKIGSVTETKADSTAAEELVVVTNLGNDSIAITDTINIVTDQETALTVPDSIKVTEQKAKYIQLLHFKEVDSVQSLIRVPLLKENVLGFYFKFPTIDPKFRLMEEGYTTSPVLVKNRFNDTITMWLPGYTADSIKLEISDKGSVLDTIEMSVKPREKAVKKNEPVKKPSMILTSNITMSRLKPGTPLRITFADPLLSHQMDKMTLKQDSLIVTNARFAFNDSIKKQLVVNYPWKEGLAYSLTIPDSTFTGIMGYSNDSITLTFSGTKEEESANLSLNIDLPQASHYIIQLMDSKDKIIEQASISDDKLLEFKYIAPGKYKVKAIDDRNGNGYWDTGKYLAGRYPERVIFYPVELELRTNWTLEEQWQIPEPGN